AASHDFAPLIFSLSVIAIIYTSLVALMQEDIKKLIAYSSVAHMGFVTMGIFAGTTQGVAGGVFQMVSHGIVSGALFLCVGIVYDRMHTREISAYGGLVNRMPLYALVFMVFTMANVGLPGTSGFVGEFMTLIGTFKVSIPTATFATTGVILSAAYALWLYRKVIFGALVKPSLASIKDLTFRESLTLMPLMALTLLFRIGAFGGAHSTRLVTGLSVCLLVVAGVLELLLPSGKAITFGGSFIVDDFARFLKILALIGSVATLVLAVEYLADSSRRI